MDGSERLDRAENLLLLEEPAPGPLSLRPPAPVWPQDCHAWRAIAATYCSAPDLADCAPMGTKVADHDKRLLYHGMMLTVTSPAITKALRVVAGQIRANRQRPDGKVGIVLDGPRGTGKSTVLQAIGVYWERRLRELYGPDENRHPVVALSVPPPVRGNVRNWAGTFAHYFGQDREGGDPTGSVIRTMRNARTLLVLVDNIDRLRTAAEAEQAFQYFETIEKDTGATFVYCGRGARGIVDPLTRDNDTPLEPDEDLWSDHPVLRTGRVGYSDEEMKKFARIVDLFDADLRLYRHERGDLRPLAPYLHKRSRGYMRALSQLICQAAQKAILTGQERITQELLDGLSLGRVEQL
ncbi:hypothetical protein [Kitasatospora sp. NPDC088548]|uniref:hypothetical protein n=1 Tax=Kitasatospora sp. NPDC088548 TaxID=3364075 RepID=UPI00382DE974